MHAELLNEFPELLNEFPELLNKFPELLNALAALLIEFLEITKCTDSLLLTNDTV